METKVYLLLSLLMFLVGLLIALSKRNTLTILIGIELILNAANLNFLAFSHLYEHIQGQVFSLFVIVIAVAEIAVALAIVIKLYQYFKISEVDTLQSLHS